MTTANSIVNDALKEIGVLAEGDTATATMADDAFRALNRILSLLSNDSSFIFSNTPISKVLAGETSFTIGTTGNLVANRPTNIDSAYVVLNGITYDVSVIDSATWDAIPYKAATASVPEAVFYDPTYPNGTLYLYPISTGATLYLRETSQVDSYASLSTSLTLPPAYETYLIKELAIDQAPMYPAIQVSPLTIRARDRALKLIMRTNKNIPSLSLPDSLLGNTGRGLAAIYKG